MTRQLLQYLPFLLPFVGYAAYIIVARSLGRSASWRTAPWLWLTTAGLVLVIAVLLVTWALDPREGIEGEYVPPRLEDGKIVPGHVVPKQGE
jgi:hypothetical protein